jgi:hypothetical protein
MLKKLRYFTLFALSFCVLFSLALKAQDKTDEEIIRVDTNLVTVPVIVSDRQNRYISGLKAENFAVLKDGQQQNIEYFIAEESPIWFWIKFKTPRSNLSSN